MKKGFTVEVTNKMLKKKEIKKLEKELKRYRKERDFCKKAIEIIPTLEQFAEETKQGEIKHYNFKIEVLEELMTIIERQIIERRAV